MTDKNTAAHIDGASDILNAFAAKMRSVVPSHFIKMRPDGPYLVIEMAKPGEHHFKALNEVMNTLPDSHPLAGRASIQFRKVAPANRLLLPETRLLQKVISESLTVDKNSFSDDFFSRYTPSVAGLEGQIVADANYVVYGRRGAGKSSLLAYAMHKAKASDKPYAWIPMQTYAGRSDAQVVAAVFSAILSDLRELTDFAVDISQLIGAYDAVAESADVRDAALLRCDRIIPRVRRLFESITKSNGTITIFLDDIHVLSESMQPVVLGWLYKACRGNRTYIKISGIAQLTKLWEGSSQMGLQPSHDAQVLNLDHNLTMPDKSKEHIVSILDAHAHYCGLPGISYLSGDDVLSRLVLVAAGVPRDSLSLFLLAVSKAVTKSQKLVSLTSLNSASSEMAEEKLKDVERDSGAELVHVREMLQEIKEFCVSEKKKNAFLVEIKNSDHRYLLIQKLVALRLVHLLHEGITPREAGRRYIALMLDYGFYVGIRAAKSVEFIPAEPRQLLAKELRALPIFQ